MKKISSEKTESSVENLALPISAGYESEITEYFCKPIIRAAGTATRLCGPGDIYSLLVTGEESNNTLFQFEASIPSGGGPPPHIHTKEDESFYIVSGTLAVLVGENWYTANKGDYIYAPRGVVHAFKNVADHPAVLFITLTPAGLDTFFREVFPVVNSRDFHPPQMTDEMIKNMSDAAYKYGVTYP